MKKPNSLKPVSEPRFEPRTSHLYNKSAKNLAATFDFQSLELKYSQHEKLHFFYDTPIVLDTALSNFHNRN
jgi:hypothetical protein